MLPDRVPVEQRGVASAAMSLGIPIGIFGGINLAALMPTTLLGYAALAFVFTTATLFLLPDYRPNRLFWSQWREERPAS